MTWIEEIQQYCEFYNIPLEYLVNTLYEPKVIPMIRGKAFEFSALLMLQSVLPSDEFEVSKQSMNAQIDSHDIDVSVTHKASGITVNVECKLAGKGRFRYLKQDQLYKFNVKCMRSRTLGIEMVSQQASKLNIDRKQLQVHNDSYIPSDFDVVLTSIANAFYITRDDGIFDWQPTQTAINFLRNLPGGKQAPNLKNFAFNSVYLAHSYDLAPLPDNEVVCTRRNCTTTNNCGFIPNYPDLIFEEYSPIPNHPWYSISHAVDFFKRIIKHKINAQ